MRRGTIRLAIVLAVVALAVLTAFMRAPLFWGRYTRSLIGVSRPDWYQPRERVAGGNEPPPPRVSPETESCDAHALESAAAYAGAHDSRALIVARHDHIVFERYWGGTGFDTLADAGSFTRVVAALVTGSAIAHRRVGWPDEPIGNFIGEWNHEARGAITVRELLQMSSGLAPANDSARLPWGASARFLFGTDVVRAALAEPLTGTPGRTWAPQAADPQLLALLLEHATGERYANFVSQALWRRIGAADAWLYLDRPGGSAHADCCMLARQGDWIRVGELLVRDGNYRGEEIVRPGWVKLMRTRSPANAGYGAYLRLSAAAGGGREAYIAADTFVVDGGGGNRLWLVPSLELAILRMGGGTHARDWDEARIPNLILGGVRDFLPSAARPAGGISGLVPGH